MGSTLRSCTHTQVQQASECECRRVLKLIFFDSVVDFSLIFRISLTSLSHLSHFSLASLSISLLHLSHFSLASLSHLSRISFSHLSLTSLSRICLSHLSHRMAECRPAAALCIPRPQLLRLHLCTLSVTDLRPCHASGIPTRT